MAETIDIPAFAATSLDAIPGKCAQVAQFFRTNTTKDVAWRKVQLRKLYWAVEDYTPQLVEALRRDLNKAHYESLLTEIDFVKNDCLFLAAQLDKLAADEKATDVPLTFAATRMRTRKEPLGAVLIIGAYNYPVNLLLCPFAGAIAAGCTAVLKPSEVAPNVAMVVQQMIEDRMDAPAFSLVNGAIAETTALLDFRDTPPGPLGELDGEEHGWAKIFYTGGRQVARIIAAKAAATLTPVVLELGGRNPAFVTGHADVALAARRLLWAKTLNAGQVCLSQNYVLVQRSVVDVFVASLQAEFRKTFPDGARNSALAHLADARHFARIKKLLDSTKGRIVMGGDADEATLFMEPTAVLVDSEHDPLLQQESFGPLFAILPVDTIPEAIRIANAIDATPLSLYTFGSAAENAAVLNGVTSGGATINDAFMHGSLNTVTFGGVGHSGTGAYRGRASFEVFTHRRSVAETPGWMERFLRVRYMPYRWSERRMVELTTARPDFDRSGAVRKGLAYWMRLVFGLGSKQGAFFRWCGCLAAVVLAVYAVREQRLTLGRLIGDIRALSGQ